LATAAVALANFAALTSGSVARETPFLFFLPVVLFSLAVGGFRVAIFSTILSGLVVDFYFLTPTHSFRLTRQGLIKEIFFVATMIAAAWVYERHRSRTEDFLRLQRKLLESAAESILITDADHRVVYWNQGAERLYGWSAAEAIGKYPRELLESTGPEMSLEDIDRQLKQNGRWHGRLLRKCKDGRSVVVESSWAIDEKSGLMLQTDLDVTKQSITESELKRANRALNTLSSVNQVLMHASSEAELLQRTVEVIVMSGGYPLAWVAIRVDDPEHSVRVGASAGEASEYLSGIDLSWAEDKPSGRGPCGTTLREGQTSVYNDFLAAEECSPWWDLARKFGLRSTVCIPLLVQGESQAALFVYAGEVNAFHDQEFTLVFEVAGDLAFAWTSLRLREQAEEERKSRLVLEDQLRQAQKMEAIGRLAGGISHDFNNLLMVIMAQTELLAMHLEGPALARTESVMKSARRAAELTHQLLAFSRKQVVQPAILSLNPILAEITNMAAHVVGEDVEITTAFSDGLWTVKVDRSQIEQVIMNLIVNARDAMPNGGKLLLETANIELTTEYVATHPLVSPGRYVRLVVSDTGVGMSDETKARLFEPFFTTKPPGKGTGLGLSMVYGIVKQSQGFVWYYSELGKGTSFKIYLPAAEPMQSAGKTELRHETVPAKVHPMVLLVEDEQSLRDVISEFLESAGYRVIAAESDEDALVLAAEHVGEIDLLLTDVLLRGRNGKELADDLRAKGCKFKVIFMSGYTANAIVHGGVLEESIPFLQKPFTRATLLAKVHEALDL
jgi:PAS domain S-box-containing protein